MNRELIKFLIKALLLFVLWKLFELHPLKTKIDAIIINSLTLSSRYILSDVLNIPTVIDKSFFESDTLDVIRILDSGEVRIGSNCAGLDLFALFAGFIFAFPGKWRNKLWYIPIGLLLIHTLNILRVCALAFINYKWPLTLDFNHKYTFTSLMYLIIFGLWMLWVKSVSFHEK